MVKALHSWLERSWFDSRPFHFQVTTLRKLFTHVPLSPSSINWYRPKDDDAVWLGRYCMSGIALAVHLIFQWFIHLRAQRLTRGRWAPCLNSCKEYGTDYCCCCCLTNVLIIVRLGTLRVICMAVVHQGGIMCWWRLLLTKWWISVLASDKQENYRRNLLSDINVCSSSQAASLHEAGHIILPSWYSTLRPF